jgi:hypothetical protein
MGMVNLGSREFEGRNARRRGWLVSLLLLVLSAPASATTFSFGTINASDQITQLSFAPGTTKTSFDPVSGVLHLEAYLSQIDFLNRSSISGIAPNSVVFTSDILLTSGSFSVTSIPPPNNPYSFLSLFESYLTVDISIRDQTNSITALEAELVGSLQLTASEPGMNGQVTTNLNALGTGDADFTSAFGNLGNLNAQLSGFFSDNASVGLNMCNLVKFNTTVYSPITTSCGAGGYALDDFTVNANMTITTTHMPEPGTALLLGLGLAGVAALRRK